MPSRPNFATGALRLHALTEETGRCHAVLTATRQALRAETDTKKRLATVVAALAALDDFERAASAMFQAQRAALLEQEGVELSQKLRARVREHDVGFANLLEILRIERIALRATLDGTGN